MLLKGYNFGRSFLGERVPQHVQNIVIRNYCEKKQYNLSLSSTEYSYKDSSYILMELLDNLKNYDGLIFYSIFQLPTDQKKRNLVYRQILKKNKQIHFAVEDIILKNLKDKKRIEEIFQIKLIEILSKKILPGKEKNYLSIKHNKVKRDYKKRILDNKVECMKVSKKYDFNYWDGNRQYGYGGYKYILNHHRALAQKLIKDYSLNKSSRILDIGCGKGFLLYEIKKIIPEIEILGLDISKYAKKNSKKEIRKYIKLKDVRKKFKFKTMYFDLVLSINVLHNLKLDKIHDCLKEIERIGKSKFICVESFRNENEQFNLQSWALTAETLIDKESWKWMFKTSNYSGDYEFIYFK